ncbi:hypothetical protein BC940DRAFT_312270 [Gongronella butleri]|nr:hypothetical protein BC940DRAFT_312270 [Gongronella butleri]
MTATCTPSGIVRTPHLQRLTLPTRRTWSADHIQHLFNVCPSLHLVSLLPAATTGHTHAPHSLNTTIHRSHLQVTL